MDSFIFFLLEKLTNTQLSLILQSGLHYYRLTNAQLSDLKGILQRREKLLLKYYHGGDASYVKYAIYSHKIGSQAYFNL